MSSMVSTPEPIELHFEPDMELVKRDQQPFSVDLIRASKVVMTVTHARYGRFDGKAACLVVLRCDFIPDYKVRFKFVELQLRVVRAQGSSIIAYRPHTWHGTPAELTTEQFPGVGSVLGGLGGSEGDSSDTGSERNPVVRRETKRAHIFSVLEDSTVTWNLSENDAKREGIPAPFSAALIVETNGKFSIRVSYHANLSKSADPRSQAPAYARVSQPVDLSQNAIGAGYGPSVAGIDEMEKDHFDLDSFTPTSWDL
jgi:hypothetical protein